MRTAQATLAFYAGLQIVPAIIAASWPDGLSLYCHLLRCVWIYVR